MAFGGHQRIYEGVRGFLLGLATLDWRVGALKEEDEALNEGGPVRKTN